MTGSRSDDELAAEGDPNQAMADLEEHAFKRDRRFLVRLVLMLAVGVIGALAVSMKLTGEDTAGCAAKAVLGSDKK